MKFLFVYLLLAEFYQQSIQHNEMYRGPEDIEEIDRLDKERVRLFIENRELKSKLEDFYKVLGWDYPNENDAKSSEFFGF